jgi:hypothetical protein
MRTSYAILLRRIQRVFAGVRSREDQPWRKASLFTILILTASSQIRMPRSDVCGSPTCKEEVAMESRYLRQRAEIIDLGLLSLTAKSLKRLAV